MPDKIKEVFELISDKGYFSDENEFRSYVSDPKRRAEAFELIKDDGFFTDENEFNSYFGEVKKKEQTMPFDGQKFGGKKEEPLLPLTSSTVSPSASKPPKSTTPLESTGGKEPKKEIIEPKDSLGSYNPVARVKLYNQAIGNIQNRIPQLVQQFNEAELAGDENAMQELKTIIDADTKKLDYFDKAIQGQKQLAAQQQPSTLGNAMANGLEMAAGTIMSGVNFVDEFIASLSPFQLSEKALKEIKELDEKALVKRPSDIIAKGGKEILKEAKKSSEETMMNMPYGGGVYDALKKGDLKSATSNAAYAFTTSLPTSLLMVNPITGSLAASGMAQESVDEKREEKGFATTDDYIVGSLKASTEYIFENMFGTGKQLKQLVSSLGKEVASETIEKTVKAGLKEYAKKLGLNIAEETFGEGLTQITQNAIDKADGKDIGLFDNVPDAALIGLFGGITQGGVTTTISHYVDRVKLKEAEVAKAKATELAEQALNAPSQVVADAIEREAEKLNDLADEIIEKNNEIGANAPVEITSQIEENNNKIDELEASIAEATPEIAEIITSQLKELELKNAELIKNAEKLALEKLGKTDESGISQETAPKGDTGVEVTEPVIEEGEEQVEIEETPTKEQKIEVKEEITPEQIETGRQEVSAVKEGKIETANPIRLFKGLFGKRNLDGTHKSAHPNAKGVFSAVDEKVAERYKGEDGMGTFDIPAGTTMEVIRLAVRNVPMSKFREQETDAINASDAQIVKLITTDAKGAEEQYVIKDPALIEKMQKPEESAKAEERENADLKDVEATAKALEDAAKDSPIEFIEEEDGRARIKGGGIEVQVEAKKADKIQDVKTPSFLSFLPKTLTLSHLARNRKDKNNIIKKGFDLRQVSIDSPIKGAYFSSEDWSTMDRFGRRKEDAVYVDIDNNGLLYFDSAMSFRDYLKENDLPYRGETLSDEQIQKLKDKGVKGILLREDFASQSRNELIVIDDSIIKNISESQKDITKLPSSFSDMKSISEAYHKAKADGSNPELVKAVEELLTPKKQEDAVQKQTAGQVPVQPETKVGEGVEGGTPQAEEAVSESKSSEPSKSDKNYQEAQEVNSIVSKENPDASVLIQPKGEDLSLTAIYVGKEKRGKGIGSKVLKSVKKQADKLGKKVVLDATNELDEETELERLGNFYEKNGFKKVGENKYEYNPKTKDSSRDIGSRADDSRAKKSDIAADTNKKQPSEKADSTEEAVSESKEQTKAEPLEATEEKQEEVAKKAGISPKNLRDLYNVNRKLFGLDRVKSLASAVAMDRMIGAMAKRAGAAKAEMYGKLKFEEGDYKLLLKTPNALFQGTFEGQPASFITLPEGISIVDGWYSPIEKRLRETKVEKQSANKWLTSGLIGKGDEAIYTGVKGWLEGKNPQEQVSKQEILDWMKDNRVEIVEVVKGDLEDLWKSAYKERNQKFLQEVKDLKEYGISIYHVEGKRDFSDSVYKKLPKNIKNKLAELMVESNFLNAVRKNEGNAREVIVNKSQVSRYSSYQLEGEKSNYKEVLVAMPVKKNLGKKSETHAEFAKRLRENSELIKFKSSHFDEPNILVHLRMNTRTDADGNKVLFLEEVQSDWGQEGKKKGFGNLTSLPEGYRIDEPTKFSKWTVVEPSGVDGNIQSTTIGQGETKAEAVQRALDNLNRRKTVSAPFVTDTNAWTKLGLKMAMREAVNQGATKIAWTTGEQQFDRWGTEKIDWVKGGATDRFSIRNYQNKWVVSDKNRPSAVILPFNSKEEAEKYVENKKNTTWSINIQEQFRGTAFEGMNVDEKALSERGVTINSKEDLKEAIDRNLSREKTETERQKLTDRIWDRMQKEDSGTSLPRKEGMEAFYDRQVRDVAKALVKELTGQKVEVGKTKITTRENISSSDKIYEAYDRNGNVIKRGSSESYIKSIAEQNNGTYKLVDAKQQSTQQSIDITPELKAQVQRGMPLFQRSMTGARGAMQAMADGTYVVYAITDPNVSTPLHELAHVFEHYLTDIERQTIIRNAGTKGWTTETSEYFARGFEKYLAEGKSPISALDKIFAKFKEWLTEIYNGIKGSDIDIKLNKKMRDIYSQMLGVEIEGGKPKKEQVVDEVKVEKSKKAFEALLKEESASPTAKKKASELKKEAGEKAVKEAAEIMENIDSIRQQLLDAGVIKSINCKWG